MPAVAAPTVEILRVQPETLRAKLALDALTTSRPARQTAIHERYEGGADWLVLWGPGEPSRAEAIRRQVAAGGRAICFDLAYWARDRKVRVSVDAPHPQAWVMRRTRPAARWLQDPAPVSASCWRPDGPVVLAGIGRKALTQYGSAVAVWEAAMVDAVRNRWPGRPILVRPKPLGAGAPPIDGVLRGASLVITWHSNVAVDAIRLGVPVVCRDGAAAAVCPDDLPDDPRPLDPALRDEFLANLAWFQWDLAREAKACWAFLQEALA